jgi:hypothetical protein
MKEMFALDRSIDNLVEAAGGGAGLLRRRRGSRAEVPAWSERAKSAQTWSDAEGHDAADQKSARSANGGRNILICFILSMMTGSSEVPYDAN